MKNTYTHHFLYKKYHQLYQKISKALRSGRFAMYSAQKKQKLLDRLARYEKRLLRKGIAVASVAALMLGTPMLQAQLATPAGDEFQVNTFTTNTQVNPSIAVDSDGDFIITWQSRQDGDFFGIYAQRYACDGSPLGNEFQVNTYTTGYQARPRIAVDSDGDFIITWQSRGQDGSYYGIYAQRYDNNGDTVGNEFQVNTYTTGYQTRPSIAVDSDGDFIITWNSYGQDGSNSSIYAQRYDNNGDTVGTEFQVNTYTTDRQSLPSIAVDSDGDFIITWRSRDQDGSFYGIYAQRYASNGSAVGSEFQVNTFTTNNQSNPSIAVDRDGDFIITWSSLGQDGSFEGIYAQRYANDGSPQGSEFQVNTNTTIVQNFPSIAVDSDGDFIITWTSSGQDGSSYGIYAQRYDSNGDTIGDEFQVNTNTTGAQSASSIAVDSDGDFIITWNSRDQDGSDYGIYAQRYENLPLAGGEFPVNTYTTSRQINPSIAVDSDGDFIITWNSYGQDGSFDGIYAQRYACDGSPLGTEFQVNTYTTGRQNLPSIGVDSDGDFIITWQSNGQDGSDYGIYAQRYDNMGNTLGTEFQVNTYTTGYQANPSIGVDSDGDFIITWNSDYQDGSSDGIYAQRYDNMGNTVGTEFQVNTYTTSQQFNPSIGVDSDGDFIITWNSSGQDGSYNGIYAQRYDNLGNTVGTEFQVNTYTTSFQGNPSIGVDSDGDFIITWQSRDQDDSYDGIYAQRYDNMGNTVGSEFQVNTYTTSAQRFPSIGVDSDGDFTITWQSLHQDGDSYGLYAQRYSSDGIAQGTEFRVNTFTTSRQIRPSIGVDSDGDFIITWNSRDQDGSSNGIYAQRYGNFCNADAGLLSNSESSDMLQLCEGEDNGLTFVAMEASEKDLFTFLLADADGTILESNAVGDFDLAVLEAGTFTVFGLSYSSSNMPATIEDYLMGKTIEDIEKDELCGDLCLDLGDVAVDGESNSFTINENPIAALSVSETSGTTDDDGILCSGDEFTVNASGGDNYQFFIDQNDNDVFDAGTDTDLGTSNPLMASAGDTNFPTGDTEVSVAVSNANACEDVTQTTITVNDNPIAALSVNETSGDTNDDGIVVAGDDFSLTASGGDNYQFFIDENNNDTYEVGTDTDLGTTNPFMGTAGDTNFPVGDTEVSVEVSDANGCTDVAQTTITVEEMQVADCPAPDINSLIAQTCEPPFFVSFDPVTEAMSYMSQITLESGEVINRCVPRNVISGKFNIPPRLEGMTVMVQLASVCVDPNTNEEFVGEYSDPRAFTIGCDPNPLNDALEERSAVLPSTTPMIVAPNPVRDQLKISFESSNRGIAELVIHDMKGSRVQQRSIAVFKGYNEEDLDLTSLSAGTYFVQLRSKDGVQQVQFVKL